MGEKFPIMVEIENGNMRMVGTLTVTSNGYSPLGRNRLIAFSSDINLDNMMDFFGHHREWKLDLKMGIYKSVVRR